MELAKQVVLQVRKIEEEGACSEEQLRSLIERVREAIKISYNCLSAGKDQKC